jgi:hypothetical protein
MKNIIKLGMLAALANVSAHAVQVDFFGSTAGPNTTMLAANVTDVSAKGYVYYSPGFMGTQWLTADLYRNSVGTGVGGVGGNPNLVEGTGQEYILIDFASTVTGTVKVDTLVLDFQNNPTSPYFKYVWTSTLPGGAVGFPNPDPTTFTNYAGGVSDPSLSGTTYTFSNVSGSGRYLLIGGINGTVTTTHYFQLQSLTYTSVPDGASTLALMGAALATLGFAGRRRKA